MGMYIYRRVLPIVLPLLVVLFLVFTGTSPTHAAINQQINFQGKLTNPDGTNVTNGTYSIVFSIYTVSSGGTAVWTETQGSVSVTDGIFRVALGSVTSLPGSVDFNGSSLYLGVKVGADSEMTPRVQFTAAPYAFNSDTLDGRDSTGFVQLGISSAQTDGSTNSSVFINKTAAGNILQLQASASNVLTLSNAGVFTLVGSLNSSGGAVSLSGNSASSLTTSSGALTITAAAASTWSTTAGNLTIQAGSGTVSLGTSTALTANGALTISSTTTSAITLDSGTTGAVNVGTGSNAKTVTIGNTTGATVINNLVGGATSAFSVQGTASAIYMQIDSTNNLLYVGNPTGDSTGFLLVLDDKNTTGDPTGVNGGSYYNSYETRNRCYTNGAWGDCQGVPRPNDRRFTTLMYPGSGTTFSLLGDIATAGTAGTAVAATTTEPGMLQFATAATTNAVNHVSGNTNYDTDNRIVYQSYVAIGTLTTVRVWLGVSNQTAATMSGNANPAGNYAAFRFDTGAGDANFKCITKDGTTQNIIDSGVAPVAATGDELEIIQTSTEVTFRIDGVRVCQSTSNLPTANRLLRYTNTVTTLANAARNIRVGWIYVETNK